MVTEGWFYSPWYVKGYFPPVWFAPADEEHLTPEERRYSNEVELEFETLKPKKRRLLVAHNGQEYALSPDELPAFLERIEQDVREVVVERAALKRTKKPAPVVKLIEAPDDTKQQVLDQLSAVNRLIRSEWALAVQNYLAYKAAYEQEEDEIELLLMAV